MPKRGSGAINGAVPSRLRVVIGAPEIILAAIVALFTYSAATEARAQSHQNSIALKSGESVALGELWYVVNCKSLLIGPPEVEILEGPPELTLSVKEEMVLPRRLNCPSKVRGAILTATAKDVKEPIHDAKLTYRAKYKTKDGDRQTAHTYNVSLFPSEPLPTATVPSAPLPTARGDPGPG